MTVPPGNSLDADQRGLVIPTGSDPLDSLELLLHRTRTEIDYNAAKGEGPYRLGMHDGLRYAEEAIVTLLQQYGRNPERLERDQDA